MAISYNKLWKLLIDKKMGRTEMALNAGVTKNVLARLSKDEPVSMGSMEKICKYLDCNIGDVMDFVPDEPERSKNM